MNSLAVFFDQASKKLLLFEFLCHYEFYLIIQVILQSILYNKTYDIIYREQKDQTISVTKNIKPSQCFTKPTTFVNFIIFTQSNKMLLSIIHFAPVNKTLFIWNIVTNGLILEDLPCFISSSVDLKLATNANIYLNIQ